jgi:plastocyanin
LVTRQGSKPLLGQYKIIAKLARGKGLPQIHCLRHNRQQRIHFLVQIASLEDDLMRQPIVAPPRWRRVQLLASALLLTLAALVACQPVQAPTPEPGPEVDRVGFPQDYQDEYTIFYEFDRPDNQTARVIYANGQAAAVEPGEPFPYGSVLVMEVYRTSKDEAGAARLDVNGRFVREELSGIFVMRKEPGFGAKYGALRNGEWEYVAYRPDQSFLTPPDRTQGCASCHMETGQGKDWVFGAHRHWAMMGETLAPSEPPTNTVDLVDYTFSSTVLTVTAGSEVTWRNQDVVFHTVNATDWSFGGMLRLQGAFRHTFEEPGEYEFLCAIHPSMRGKIVVTAQ